MRVFVLTACLLACSATPDAADDGENLCQDISRNEACEHRIACPYDEQRYGGIKAPPVPIYMNNRLCTLMSRSNSTAVWCCK